MKNHSGIGEEQVKETVQKKNGTIKVIKQNYYEAAEEGLRLTNIE